MYDISFGRSLSGLYTVFWFETHKQRALEVHNIHILITGIHFPSVCRYRRCQRPIIVRSGHNGDIEIDLDTDTFTLSLNLRG